MKSKALDFIVDASVRLLVEDRVRRTAGEALARLVIAPVDGTPRYRITAFVGDAIAPSVMRAVMNALDEKG